jgi:threonine/homoserine/homoserine lactone efflux protein
VTLQFLLTSLIVVVTPGTGVLYTLAAALNRGYRASIIAAVGCTLGIVPQMAAAIFGLAAVLNASALAFQTIKYIGVAYLVYLAWSTLRQRGALDLGGQLTGGSAAKVIATAILINLLNPKLTIFFFAFLPQFVGPHDPHPIAVMAELSLVFMAMTLVVFIAYGLLASRVRDHILSRPGVMTWLRRTFAGAFVALAARLALAER